MPKPDAFAKSQSCPVWSDEDALHYSDQNPDELLSFANACCIICARDFRALEG